MVAAATAEHRAMLDAIKMRPIAERIAWVLTLADRHATEFAGPEAWLARKRYHAQHPTVRAKTAAIVCTCPHTPRARACTHTHAAHQRRKAKAIL